MLGGHQRFNFSRGLPIPPRARAAPNDGKHDTVLFTTVPDLKQHRIVLKVLVELFLCGFTGTNFALDVIAAAIARAQQLRRPLSPAGLELMHSIGGFFKSYGREYLGITSRSAQDFETENASVLEERPIEYEELLSKYFTTPVLSHVQSSVLTCEWEYVVQVCTMSR